MILACGVGILRSRGSHGALPDVKLTPSVMYLWTFERVAYGAVRKIG